MSNKTHRKYPGYSISNEGLVTGLKGKRFNCTPRKDGYIVVGLLNIDGGFDAVYLHRLVASCFLDLDIDDGSIEVDHINDIRSDCKVSNLQLLSCSQNNLKAAGNDLWTDISTIDGQKICRKCKISKDHSDFGRNRKHTDGLHSYCKKCVRMLSYGH